MPDLTTTRRKLLTTTAVAGTAALAGCGGGGGGGSSGGSSAAFESVEIDGEQLVVQLAGDTVSKVNVIGPSGEPSLGSQSVAAGASQVSFNLLQNYQPGEHTVVAVAGEGNEIGSTTQRLEPELKLTKVLTAEMTESREVSTTLTQTSPLLQLQNTGNAPAKLSYIHFENVPNPSSEQEYMSTEAAGFTDEDGESITVVGAGESISGETAGSVLYLSYNSDFECGTTKEATITIGYQGGQEATYSVPMQYEEQSGAAVGCDITVTEQP